MNKNLKLKKSGRWYFSKETERSVFFILTMIMLLVGIIVKLAQV